MQTTNKLRFSKSSDAGCRIYYYPEDRLIAVNGWCDQDFHIEGGEVTLKEFLEGLGITLEDVKAVLED